MVKLLDFFLNGKNVVVVVVVVVVVDCRFWLLFAHSLDYDSFSRPPMCCLNE